MLFGVHISVKIYVNFFLWRADSQSDIARTLDGNAVSSIPRNASRYVNEKAFLLNSKINTQTIFFSDLCKIVLSMYMIISGSY